MWLMQFDLFFYFLSEKSSVNHEKMKKNAINVPVII